MIPLEGDAGIRWLVELGYSDDEVVDALFLGDLHGPGAMHERRRLLEASIRVRAELASRENLTRSTIRIARDAEIAAGGRGGEDAVAKRLNTSPSTLKRRRGELGLIPWPKDWTR